jgi:hypothetical protein
MSYLPVSATLTLGLSAPSAEYCFDGGVDPGGVPEPEEHLLDNDTSTDEANNALDTTAAEVSREDPATSWKKGSFYSNKKGTLSCGNQPNGQVVPFEA